MVAPTGVNEEIPPEPVKSGLTGAQPAEGAPAPAPAPEGELAEAVPRQADPEEAEFVKASHAELTDAGPKADAGPKEAEPEEDAQGEPADTELAEAGPADAELTDAEPAGPDWDATEESRGVSPLAVAGIILGVIALVGVAVGVLSVITHGFRPKTVITYRYRPAAVFGLRPGQCIDSGGNGLTFTVLSCAAPHDAEVFATFSLPAAAWPGTSAVQQDAGNACASRLATYLNPQLATAALSQEYVYPNQAAWQVGERTVVCEVRAVSGQLTGSVRA
jgi:Septum formation